MIQRNPKLTKKEIVATIASIVETTQSQVDLTIDALIGLIVNQLKEGNEITITGLGTFAIKNKPERIGINPATKEKIKIPAKNVLKFKPAKNLKEAIV